MNPPPHANPKVAAREGIKARQIMIEGIEKDLRLGQMGSPQLKEELNKILNELGLEGSSVRSALIQRRRGILVEVENDAAATWLRTQENRVALCNKLGEGGHL